MGTRRFRSAHTEASRIPGTVTLVPDLKSPKS
jgi:hypothetical protein